MGKPVRMTLAATFLAGLATGWLQPAFGEEPKRRSAVELMDVMMWNREPIGGPFALTDPHGQARTEADFQGKLRLVYFGYTGCPDICPTDLYQIARLMELLGGAAGFVQPIFVTLDPEHDTSEILSDYVAAFHPRLIALSGSAEAVRKAADAYKVFYQRVDDKDGRYRIDHSAFIYLMDRDGGYLGFFPPSTTAERMLTILKPHLTPEN